MNNINWGGSRSVNASSTSLGTLDLIIRSLSQSGISKASSDVSTKYAY